MDNEHAIIPAAQSANQILSTWLDNQTSGQTRRAYEADVTKFWEWVQAQFGVQSLAEVQRMHLIAYREALHASGKANATIVRYLTSLNMFFREAIEAGHLTTNPASPKAVKRPAVSNVSPRHALDNREIRALLSQPKRETVTGARDFAILMLLAYLGLRRAEVCDLTIGSIGHERGHTTLRVVGKGDKTRLLPIPPRVFQAIRHWLDVSERTDALPADPLFISTHNNRWGKVGGPLSTDSIWRMICTYAVAAEIDPERARGERGVVMPHVLRHTAITNALDNGAPPRRVQYMAGHAKYETTMRYDSRRDDLDDSATWKVSYDN